MTDQAVQDSSREEKETLIVDLEEFEGPLDLLLHLIRKHNIDIFDIPIVEITEQYMAYIDRQREANLDVDSEYLVMAASLVEIKSKLLLPKPQKSDEEEEEDPRHELVEQLLTYQQYQELGQVLEEKQEARTKVYSKDPANLSDYQEKIPLQENELSSHDLVKAIERMVDRLKAEQPVHTVIHAETYTLSDAREELVSAFSEDEEKSVSFFRLLGQGKLTRERVVTIFLAILQLTKEERLLIRQDDIAEDIWLKIRKETS